MQLKEISQILSGYTFRGAIKSDGSGDTLVFQAKNISRDSLYTDDSVLTRIAGPNGGRSAYLTNRDVVLVTRGMTAGAFRSTVFDSNAANVIASSSVHILRVTDGRAIPEYISYYLNSDPGQYALTQIVSGSYIGSISRRGLEEVDIPLPDLNSQKLMVQLIHDMQEHHRLMGRKYEIYQNIINGLFRKAATL